MKSENVSGDLIVNISKMSIKLHCLQKFKNIADISKIIRISVYLSKKLYLCNQYPKYEKKCYRIPVWLERATSSGILKILMKFGVFLRQLRSGRWQTPPNSTSVRHKSMLSSLLLEEKEYVDYA